MHSSHIPKSSSTATSSATTSTSVTASRVSQPESAAGRRLESSFVSKSTTVHTPESRQIPTDYPQQAGLRLLAEASLSSEASASQHNPFQALATHQTVTFDDDDQEQFDDFSSLIDKPFQPVEGSEPVVREEPREFSLFILLAANDRDTTTKATTSIPKRKILPPINDQLQQALSGTVPEVVLTEIATIPRHVSVEFISVRKPNQTDKWIILTGDKEWSFKCGYESCGRIYITKQGLKKHIVNKHIKRTKVSRLRCYFGNCNGEIKYRNNQLLTRHIHVNHTFERPHNCNICGHRFRRSHHLKYHKKHVHVTGKETKPPKLKKP